MIAVWMSFRWKSAMPKPPPPVLPPVRWTRAVAHPESGEVICKTGAKIGEEEVGLMMEAGVREIQVRNPVNGIAMRALLKDGDEIVSLSDRIVGRFLAEKVLHPQTQKVIYKAGTYITEKEAEMIAEADVGEVKVRSPVTCEAGHGCASNATAAIWGAGGWRSWARRWELSPPSPSASRGRS